MLPKERLVWMVLVAMALGVGGFGGYAYAQTPCPTVVATDEREHTCPSPCPEIPPCPPLPALPDCVCPETIDIRLVDPAQWRFHLNLSGGQDIAQAGLLWNRQGRLKPYIAVIWTDSPGDLTLERKHEYWWHKASETITASHDEETRLVGGVQIGFGRQ